MSSLLSFRSFFILSFLLPYALAEQRCYALNGTELSAEYGACDPNAKHSGCCAINRPAGSAELCLSNGLCMATNEEYMGTIWQNGCTDPTGTDPSCPKMCPDARNNFNGGSKVSAWNVQTCDYGSYCCRSAEDHENCCNNVDAPKIKTKFLGAFQFETSAAGASTTITPTSTSASSPTSSSPSSTTSRALHLAAATPNDTIPSSTSHPITLCASEKRQTAIVGGTLAGVLGAAIAGLLGLIYYLHKKEKKQRKLKEHYESQFAISSWKAYGVGSGSKSTVVDSDITKDQGDQQVKVKYIGKERDF